MSAVSHLDSALSRGQSPVWDHNTAITHLRASAKRVRWSSRMSAEVSKVSPPTAEPNKAAMTS